MRTIVRYLAASAPLACVLLLWPAVQHAHAQSELTVLKTSAESEQTSQELYEYLTAIAWDYLDARKDAIGALSTPEQVSRRKALVRERILSTLGPLPEKTPLRSEVTGTLRRGGYRIENVVYQSQPGFYVTGNLYIPEGDGPFPGVLGTCGHSMNGKAADVYQSLWVDLARMGMVVLTFDPIGQGERLMYWDEDLGETWMQGTTTEHSLPGIQCLLTGSSSVTYFVWDMIRSIDYLVSREEVDPERLAVTGNSGGGMQTAYIAALDDRLSVAVPSCYITSWKKLWSTIGPQDAEQNILPFIGNGLDFGDYILCFAPRPYMMNTAIQDFFSIVGARDTYAEAREVYSIFGAEDRVRMFEADDFHGYTLPRREACMTFMGRHLLGLEGEQKEQPLRRELDRALEATPTGQVITSYDDAESMASLNRKLAEKIMYEPASPSSEEQFRGFRSDLLDKVREACAFERHTGPLEVQVRGYVERPGMKIELITYLSEPGIVIPALLFLPEKRVAGKPAVLWAADWSKSDDADGDIAELVRSGHVVLAPDLRGKGETARASLRSGLFQEWFSRDWDMAMMAFHVRKSLVGMRALDLIRGVDLLTEREGEAEVIAVARGSAWVPVLHAAAFDERIGSVVAENGLVSWKSVVDAKYHRRQLDNVVMGALAVYDLPALAATLAPRPLILGSMADPMGHPLPASEVSARYGQAVHCYRTLGAQYSLEFTSRPAGLSFGETYGSLPGM